MSAFRSALALVSVTQAALACTSLAAAADRFGVEQALDFPAVESVVAAKSGSRIAWVFDQRGARNVWAAEAPEWKAHALTDFTADDGKEISQLSLSSDGATAVFVRDEDGGNWPPADGTHPNPAGMPVAQKVEIWTASATGRGARLLAEGDAPAISPKGDRVAFIRGGQAFIAAVSGGEKSAHSLFFARGKTRELMWSPDGSQLAFVSDRGSHSLIGVFRSAAEPIRWMVPSTNQVVSPRWSPDGKQLAFVKLPGAGGDPQTLLDRHPLPFELWVADPATGAGRSVWKSPNTIAGSFPDTDGEANLAWGANERLVFTAHLDGWPHLYSVPVAGGEPLLLTPGSFMVEHVSPSSDARTIVYAANTGTDANDDDRRHVFRVPVDRPLPTAVTSGAGLEWSPVVTGDGRAIAFIGSGPKNSPLPAVIPIEGGAPKIVGAEQVPATFAGASFVQPRKVVFAASDGLSIHGQLFEGNAGDTDRPALIYVHGGPPRQMLLGFHYMTYYARDYAVNQYLANRGFVVLSVNYRLGIGYGDAFKNPPAAGYNGASEYLDVLAGARYLQSLPGVDAKRLGIWGGSYGGYLTALALARNSEVFSAGVDLHGVHNWITALEQEGTGLETLSRHYEKPADLAKALDVMWQSSPVADVNRWRSPVLFIHGDDDRNVEVSQTVDLAERLRSRGVRFEELIIPDETHDWLLFRSWVKVSQAASDFLTRELAATAHVNAESR